MKRAIRIFLPAAISLVLGAASLQAQETSLQLDPSRTKVEFTLSDVLHTVHGAFAIRRGTIHFQPSGKAEGELVVDAASGNSGSDGRDRRMHTNILESSKYPDIVFRPDRVDGKVATDGKSEVQVHGMFAIHGSEHELTLPFEVEAAGGQYTATTHFQVPYVKWGMKNPSTFVLRVSDKVEIAIHAVFTPGT